MNDIEIESLLEEAGFQYNVAEGMYQSDGDEDEEAQSLGTEELADELDIPLDDLVRWEEEQREADESAE